MILGARAIEHAIAAGQVRIEPFSADRLRSASYVLHLNCRFRRWRKAVDAIRLWAEIADDHLHPIEEASKVTIGPGEFVLAQTIETISLPRDIAGQISPLSHIARFGLSIHCGADWINPGFAATRPAALTLEMVNHTASPLCLDAGMPIAHLRLAEVRGAFEGSMPSVYEVGDPLQHPRLFEEMRSKSRPAFGDAS